MTNKHKKHGHKKYTAVPTGLYPRYVPEKLPCHWGNKPIMTIGTGVLFAGGFSRGAVHSDNMLLVDLAGNGYRNGIYSTIGNFESVNKIKGSREYINLPIADYDVPTMGFEFWYEFADDIKSYLESGKNVLIACDGGHGRTGLVLSILYGILTGDIFPVETLKAIYCREIIETNDQEEYVYCMLDKKVYIPKVYDYRFIDNYNYADSYNFPSDKQAWFLIPDTKEDKKQDDKKQDDKNNNASCLSCKMIFSKDDLYHGYCVDCIGGLAND